MTRRWQHEMDNADATARAEQEPEECRNPVCRKQGDPDYDGYCSRMCDHDHWFHAGIER